MGGREDAVGRSHIYETNLLSGARSAARCGARSARGGLVAMPTCSLVPPQGPRTGRRCTNVAQTPHEDERDGVTYYFCRTCNRGYNRVLGDGRTVFGMSTVDEWFDNCEADEVEGEEDGEEDGEEGGACGPG